MAQPGFVTTTQNKFLSNVLARKMLRYETHFTFWAFNLRVCQLELNKTCLFFFLQIYSVAFCPRRLIFVLGDLLQWLQNNYGCVRNKDRTNNDNLTDALTDLFPSRKDGRTALHFAAGYSRDDTVRTLLAKDADPFVAGGVSRPNKHTLKETAFQARLKCYSFMIDLNLIISSVIVIVIILTIVTVPSLLSFRIIHKLFVS